jgi:hypothetical protein
MMRALWVLSMMMALTAGSALAGPETVDSKKMGSGGAKAALIVPGESIGELKLGMAEKEAIQQLGKADDRTSIGDWSALTWVANQKVYQATFAYFDSGGKLAQIGVQSPAFKTAGGLAVDSSREAFEKAFPAARAFPYNAGKALAGSISTPKTPASRSSSTRASPSRCSYTAPGPPSI